MTDVKKPNTFLDFCFIMGTGISFFAVTLRAAGLQTLSIFIQV